MKAVILSAGLGTRLGRLSSKRSKAMLPLLGRPLIQWVLDTILPLPIREAIFIIAPEDTLIQPYLETHLPPGLPRRYLVQHQRLGMAHALRLLNSHVEEPFILSACDSFISAEFVEEMSRHPAEIVLALQEVPPERVSRSASVRFQGDRITAIVEKPRPEEAFSNIVSLPLYLLPPEAVKISHELKKSPRGEYEIQDLITRLIGSGRYVSGVLADERLQVSSAEDYLELTTLLLERNPPAIPSIPGVRMIPPVMIERDVVIGEGSEIGPRVHLQQGCRLGPKVRIRNSVVLGSAQIQAGRDIEAEVLS